MSERPREGGPFLMLNRLKIERFKSWKNTGEIRLAPLTALFGTNSSGKTSLLQLLLMLKQTVESTDRSQVLNLGDDRSLVSLGSFRDILFEHDRKAHLSWSLSWTPDQDSDDLLFHGSKLGFESEISEEEDSGRLIVNRFRYAYGHNSFAMARNSDGEDRYDLEIKTLLDMRRLRGKPWDLPSPVKCYGFPD